MADKTIEALGGEDTVRDRLLRHKDEILEMYKQDLKAGMETSDEGSDDLVDRANNAYHREFLFSLSDGERTALLRIEEALERLENDRYGVCIACEEPIGAPRLEAVPWARYCIDCQELAERGMLEES